MKKKNLTPEELYKRYLRLKIAFAVLLGLFIGFFYINYDYLVFKLLIAGNYIYTDTLDQMYGNALGEDNVKEYFRNFDETVIAVVTEKIREIGGDRYTYLYNPNQYKLSKELVKAEAAEAKIEELTPDTVYLTLPNISKYVRQFVYNHKEMLKPYQNLVLDLRDNYGGDLADLYKISDLFLDQGATICYEVTRLPFLTKKITAKGNRYFDFERIIILQNENTASAAEGLIMSLKENIDSVSTIGATTFGKGIGQVTIPLTDGYAVKATVLKVQTPSAGSIHKVGIEPDFPWDEDEEDPVAYALAHLQP